jgi:Fe-S-cluster containining protein
LTKSFLIKLVPCNGCTLCCQGDAIRLEEEDLQMNYKTEPHLFYPGALMLAHKPNGDCIYLDEKGCSIHDHAPSLCRTADCRSVALNISLEEALELHRMRKLDFRVWDQGQKMIDIMRAEGKKDNNP